MVGWQAWCGLAVGEHTLVVWVNNICVFVPMFPHVFSHVGAVAHYIGLAVWYTTALHTQLRARGVAPLRSLCAWYLIILRFHDTGHAQSAANLPVSGSTVGLRAVREQMPAVVIWFS